MMVPSSVQTGSSKGVKVMAQQWNGNRLNGARDLSLCPPHSVFHSGATGSQAQLCLSAFVQDCERDHNSAQAASEQLTMTNVQCKLVMAAGFSPASGALVLHSNDEVARNPQP